MMKKYRMKAIHVLEIDVTERATTMQTTTTMKKTMTRRTTTRTMMKSLVKTIHRLWKRTKKRHRLAVKDIITISIIIIIIIIIHLAAVVVVDPQNRVVANIVVIERHSRHFSYTNSNEHSKSPTIPMSIQEKSSRLRSIYLKFEFRYGSKIVVPNGVVKKKPNSRVPPRLVEVVHHLIVARVVWAVVQLC